MNDRLDEILESYCIRGKIQSALETKEYNNTKFYKALNFVGKMKIHF